MHVAVKIGFEFGQSSKEGAMSVARFLVGSESVGKLAQSGAGYSSLKWFTASLRLLA
jgi:hypothetical protein